MKKVLYVILIVVLLGAMAASGLYLWNYFQGSRQDAAMFSQLSEQKAAAMESTAAAPTETEPTAEVTVKEEPTEPAETTPVDVDAVYGTPDTDAHSDVYMTPDEIEEEDVNPVRSEKTLDPLPWYQELHDKNPDMVGWLTIEGTKVDYPVMQTDSDRPNYYLYRNFDKEQSVRGCIYAQEACDITKPSDNITLFGHNMKDGSMFNCLARYYDQAIWEENPLVFFDTLYESHVYKIFSVFKTSGTDGVGFAYHLMADAENEKEFDEFIAACKSLSFYDTGITPAYGDKILCLSTCEYTLDNGRFVVAAVRIA